MMNEKNTERIRTAVLILAVAFLLIGGFRGEAAEVFKKATQICLSCMGIG